MVSCAVQNCINHEERSPEDAIAEQFSYHTFPDDEELRQKWLKEINQEDFEPTPDSTICSLHFSKECFILDSDGVGHLKEDSVPTQFEFETIMDTDGVVETIKCCAPNCNNFYQEDSPISFHPFPVDTPELCDEWLVAMNVDQLAADAAVLCSEHFEDDCFVVSEDGQRHMITDATPSIFNFTNNDESRVEETTKPSEMAQPSEVFENGESTESADGSVNLVEKHDSVVLAMNEASTKLMELVKQRTQLEKTKRDLDTLLRVVVGGNKLDRTQVKGLTAIIRNVDEIAQQVVVDCLAPCVALQQPLQPVD